MKNKISLIFNKSAEKYDREAFNQSLGTKYLSQIETRFVLENCPIKEGEKVLDIGIGTGRFSKLLLNKGAVIDGIDVSDRMMKQAKQKLKGKRIHFKIVDAGREIPYPNNTFDCVVCIRVLKYIPNWRNSIREVSRAIKDTGVFIFDIANLYSVAYFGLKRADYFLFNFNEVKRILKREGFKITKIKAGSRFPFPLYAKINNSFILEIFECFEWLLDKILPKTVLSRNILISCKKS